MRRPCARCRPSATSVAAVVEPTPIARTPATNTAPRSAPADSPSSSSAGVAVSGTATGTSAARQPAEAVLRAPARGGPGGRSP